MLSLSAPTPTVKPASIAFVIGAADAARGEIAVPESIFTHRDDKREYCRGYESVRGATLTTRYFLGSN